MPLRAVFLVFCALALALAPPPASATKKARYGLEGDILRYDEERAVFVVKVRSTRVSGQFGSAAVAGKPLPDTVKRGQEIELRVVPEGSVLRRTVIKGISGGGLDTTGTREGFKKAVDMIPDDRAVVLSVEPNDESDPGAPEFRCRMVLIRMTEDELRRFWEERLVEE